MSKQTRLNFSRPSSAPSKRRRLTSDDDTNEKHDLPLQDSESAGTLTREKRAPKQLLPSSAKPAHAKTQIPPGPDPQATMPNPPTTNDSNRHLTLTYQKASLFSSPPATVLCHATNAQGTWGAGIAAAFKRNYPAAFKLYASRCAAWDSSSLLGTAFLIPPQKKSATKVEREAEHWIGCLFTSEKKGKGKGSKESILAATGEAIEDLVRQVRAVNEAATEAENKSKAIPQDRIAEVRMCKINSGLFGVPWEATSEVIEATEIAEGDIEEIAVYSMD